MKDSNHSFDTSFLKNTNDASSDELKKFTTEDALAQLSDHLDKLGELSDKMASNIEADLNKHLATGNCYVKEHIVFLKQEGEPDRPIWFPEGNALEWQAQNSTEHSQKAKKVAPFAKKLDKLLENSGLKQYEILINNSVGRFSLSREAILLGRELSKNPFWGGVVLAEDKLNGEPLGYDSLSPIELPRHDKTLIKVFDVLGDKANSGISSLEKVVIFEPEYHIFSNDNGIESVTPKNRFEFLRAAD